MEKLKRICAWITSALILVMAVLLVVSCVSIYQSGSRPFTRDVIGAYASRLTILGILCLLSVAIGLLLPHSAEKTKAVRDQGSQLRRYQADLPEAKQEQKYRLHQKRICSFIPLALFAYPIVYLFDPAHFGVTDVNGDVLRATLVVLIPTVVTMALWLNFLHRIEMSFSREIEIYRSNGIKPGKAPARKNKNAKRLAILRIIGLTTGIVLVIIGALNGGAADVLGKAIRICTECIGLG